MNVDPPAVKRHGRPAGDGRTPRSAGQSMLMPETSQSPPTFSIVIVTQFL